MKNLVFAAIVLLCAFQEVVTQRNPADSNPWIAALIENWPLTLVGLLGVVAALWTLSAIKHQGDDLARQTKILGESATTAKVAAQAAQASANAALKSVEAFKNSERAWIDIALRQVGPSVYELSVLNCGKTVAKIRRYVLTPKLSELNSQYDLPGEIQEIKGLISSTAVTSSKLLVPGEPWTPTSFNLVQILGKADFDDVWNNRRGLACYCTLHYDDIAGEPHQSECCYYLNTARTLERIHAAEYNKIT